MNYEKLKSLREKSNFTMQDIANKLNIAKSTYSLWEEGIERIPLQRLIELSDFYNFSIDYIIDNNIEIQYQNFKKGINKKKFAENLKQLRKELKYTQEKFANILNLTRSTIINYEKGNTLPLLDHIIFISKKYNISADYLLGKINEPKYLK